MLGYCTLGMKGIAEKPGAHGAFEELLYSINILYLYRSGSPLSLGGGSGRTGEGPRFTGLRAGVLGRQSSRNLILCKNLPRAGMESVGSPLPDPKGIF